MAGLITRDDLRSLLTAWQAGNHSAADIHSWAEARFAVSAWECEDDVANEVLAQLDMLDMNLVTRDDIPDLLAMLDVPSGLGASASQQFEARMSSSDLERRRTELAADPMYAPFCGS
jgi:hypothetical protein